MRFLSLLAFVVAVGACAAPPPPPPPPPPAPAPAPDAFSEFEGAKVSGEGIIRLANTPVGVSGLRVLLSLVRTRWSEMPSPDGGVSRTGTVEVFVQRGNESETVSIAEGESETALGCVFTAVKVGEIYDEPTMRYVAYAELKIQEALAP